MTRTKVFKPFQLFFQHQAASGIILLAGTLVALVCANSALKESYDLFWHLSFAEMSLRHWTNDGLMAIFFFVVGLEIKREITGGELSSIKKAALPIAAAIGGMIVPALIFTILNWGQSSIRGWGIPMATDIAFALGILSLLGKRVPTALKVFLTALAIADDVGAILIIAVFYTNQISWFHLIGGFVCLLGLYALNQLKVTKAFIYLILGCVIWLLFLKSGIHATVAGVLLAMVTPAVVGVHLENILHPWVSFGIMPVFALANAGVSFASGSIANPVSLGIIIGLVIGKQMGITFFSWLAVRLRYAALPKEINWMQIYSVSWLGGIGFTMSLFIANLALGESTELEQAKVGILVASLLSGIFGAWLLNISLRKNQNVRDE